MRKETEQFFILIRKYLEIHLPLRRGASIQTVRSYKAAISQFIDYLIEEKRIEASEISFNVVTEDSICEFLNWIESRGCSIATRNQRLAALRSFLSFAAKEDIAHMAVLVKAQRVPIKKTPSTPVGYLREEELSILFAQPDKTKDKGLRDLAILVFLYDTAARASELTTVTLEDLHLKGRCPYVVLHGKGNKTRSVPLMDRSVKLLENYLARFHANPNPISPLFYTIIGGKVKYMSYENVSKIVTKYGKQAKQACEDFPDHLHPHILRHTRAMHLYQDGIPLSYIKEVLGHSNINTTSIYASANIEMLQKAMKPLDINLPTAIPLPSWKDDREQLMRMAGLR